MSDDEKVTITLEEYQAYVELTRYGCLAHQDDPFLKKLVERVVAAHNKRLKPQEEKRSP